MEEQNETEEEIIHVMSSQRGRSFVWKILEQARVFNITFSTDPLLMAFNEGRRNEGVKIFNEIMFFCPSLYTKMQEENNGKQ